VKIKTMRRAAALALVALSASLLGASAAQADVNNGTFDSTVDGWWSYGTSSLVAVDGQMCATSTAAARWDAGVGQTGINLTAGAKTLTFSVTGSGDFQVNVETPENTPTFSQGFSVDGTETFTYDFTAAETVNGKVMFEVGGNAEGHTICFDDISITDAVAAPVTVIDHDFASGNPGYWSYANGGATYEISTPDGALCYTTDAANRWDAGLGFNGWTTEAGDATLTFDVKGEGTYKVNVEVPDGTSALGEEFSLGDPAQWAPQSFDFEIPAGTGKLMFEVGGNDVCFDNITLVVTPGEGEEEPQEPGLLGGVNLLNNGDFSNGAAPFGPYGHTGGVVDGQYCAVINGPLADPWGAGLGYDNIELPAGDYEFSFDAATTGSFTALVQQNGGAYTTYSSTTVTGEELTHYDLSFTLAAPVASANLQFHFGPLAADQSYEYCIDNVYLGAPAVEYVTNGDFSDTQDPWKADGVTSASIDSGALCVEVPGGTTNPWDVNIHYDAMQLPKGPYTLSFKASGTGGPMRAIVGLGAAPYTVYTEYIDTPGEDLEQHTVFFTMNNASDNAQIAFQVGGSSTPWTFCVDDVSLLSGGEKPPYAPETGPRVKVNQHGYVPGEPMRATLVTESTDPVTWELERTDDEATVATGTSIPRGVDPSAGLNVHEIDFSGITAGGEYVLHADGDSSYVFSIGAGLYEPLLTDALNYFYLARSGIEIEAAIVGDAYARPAGHVSEAGGSDTNQGDYNVACQPVEESEVVYGEPWTCDYTLDVVGGWYDAGDHGKYVVNGGIAVAQLLSTYERALRAGSEAVAALGDGTLNVPETGNGVPDVLDEAKWELDFFTSMMVPEGEELEGMVHHKIHDYGWTGLPLLPHNDDKVRYLHRPSTAATLNFVATAAQGARLFKDYDADYAAELLANARVAWAAALANPEIYAPAADGNNGGGPYDDDNVTDEFYWAAAELYLTTGEKAFEDFLLGSPIADANSFPDDGFFWGQVDALAKINLATVDNAFPGRHDIIDQVVAGAQLVASVQAEQPFGQALPADKFVWGSNSAILNNMVVLGAGYDLSGDESLRQAAYESMDYLLGRNALANSYITDYGTVFSKNQHSRWFANQLNPEMPNPPRGSVAGGPNADFPTWDPTFQALYPNNDCAPQLCYVDEISSWATNEITVNWNSALSQAVAYLSIPEAPVDIPDKEFTKAPKPTISGDKYLGATLKATVGTWTPKPTKFTYQWYRNGKAISGATKSSYKITSKDSQKKISVKVTATKAGYQTVSKTSSAVTLKKLFKKAPKPSITGFARPGSTLKAKTGTWSPKAKFAYQWYRDGKAIKNATKSTYTLKKADAGAKITVKVTGKRSGYHSTPRVSPARTVVKLNFARPPIPKITGDLKVGKVQKVIVGTWSPAATTYTYQWYRNGKAIKGATGKTYKLVAADRGTYLSVVVTGHKKGYNDRSQKGAKTIKVK